MTCSGHKMTAPNRQNTPINNTLHYDALAVIRNQKISNYYGQFNDDLSSIIHLSNIKQGVKMPKPIDTYRMF